MSRTYFFHSHTQACEVECVLDRIRSQGHLVWIPDPHREPAATDATPRTRITLSGPVRFFTDPQSGNTVIEYDEQEAAIPAASEDAAALRSALERITSALVESRAFVEDGPDHAQWLIPRGGSLLFDAAINRARAALAALPPAADPEDER